METTIVIGYIYSSGLLELKTKSFRQCFGVQRLQPDRLWIALPTRGGLGKEAMYTVQTSAHNGFCFLRILLRGR